MPKGAGSKKRRGELPSDKTQLLCHSGSNLAEETAERSARPMGALGIHDKKIWRVRDVAEFLGCSKWHVYNLASDEKIPKIKKGKFIYFVPERIHNWVLEGDLE